MILLRFKILSCTVRTSATDGASINSPKTKTFAAASASRISCESAAPRADLARDMKGNISIFCFSLSRQIQDGKAK